MKEVNEALFMLWIVILLFYQFFGNILLFSKKYKLWSYIKYSYIIMSLMILLSLSPNFSKETDWMARFFDFMISLFGFWAIFLYYLPILIIQLIQFRNFKKEKQTLIIPFLFIILSLFLIIHKLVLCNWNLNCIITNKVYLNEKQIEELKEKKGVEKYYKKSFSDCQNLKVLKNVKTKRHELYCNWELRRTIY